MLNTVYGDGLICAFRKMRTFDESEKSVKTVASMITKPNDSQVLNRKKNKGKNLGKSTGE